MTLSVHVSKNPPMFMMPLCSGIGWRRGKEASALLLTSVDSATNGVLKFSWVKSYEGETPNTHTILHMP